MSEIKKEDTSAKEIIGDIKNIEDTTTSDTVSTTDSGTNDTASVKVEGTDAAVKPDIKVEVKKETPKKKEPERFGQKDRVYTNTPLVVMHNDTVTIDLKDSGREFDRGTEQIEVFRCAGKTFKFSFNKRGGEISGVKDVAEQEAVARSLVAMYETSTTLLE